MPTILWPSTERKQEIRERNAACDSRDDVVVLPRQEKAVTWPEARPQADDRERDTIPSTRELLVFSRFLKRPPLRP